MYRKESIMPMPQYNGPTYGYNPYQTYLPQSPWQGPQPYTQPQTAQLPVQQVQTQANPPLVGHIVTANDQIPVSEVQPERISGRPAEDPGSGSGLHGAEPERLLRLPAELLSVLRLLSHGKKV
jgi:hypothetical protein